MSKDEIVARIAVAAQMQKDAETALERSLDALAAVPLTNRAEINKAANAANYALRALRACYAIEIGRSTLGDGAEEESPKVEGHNIAPHGTICSYEEKQGALRIRCRRPYGHVMGHQMEPVDQ